jgi:hypothetical protein
MPDYMLISKPLKKLLKSSAKKLKSKNFGKQKSNWKNSIFLYFNGK